MKQRKPLQQRTEPQRKTPLRRTEFKRGGALPVKPRKTGLKPGRGRQSAEEEAGRELLEARSGGVCEVQVPGHCSGRAQVWSHRKRRGQSSMAEKWCPTNGLAGCGPCELYLTDHGSDPEVRANGWTVYPSPKIKPGSIPALRRGEYVWLFADGSKVPCDLAEIAAWIGAVA